MIRNKDGKITVSLITDVEAPKGFSEMCDWLYGEVGTLNGGWTMCTANFPVPGDNKSNYDHVIIFERDEDAVAFKLRYAKYAKPSN